MYLLQKPLTETLISTFPLPGLLEKFDDVLGIPENV